MDVPTQVEGDDLFKEWFYQKAKLNCYSYVQAFLKCAHNRTVSLAWSCRQEHKAMKQCINGFYRKANFRKYKQEYVKQSRKEERKQIKTERESSECM